MTRIVVCVSSVCRAAAVSPLSILIVGGSSPQRNLTSTDHAFFENQERKAPRPPPLFKRARVFGNTRSFFGMQAGPQRKNKGLSPAVDIDYIVSAIVCQH